MINWNMNPDIPALRRRSMECRIY